MKFCIIDGCDKKRHVKIGYCSTHYRKFMVHGDPEGGRSGPTPGEPLAWIERNLSTLSDQCLYWPYGKNQAGTGVVRWEGSLKTVYKVIGELKHGKANEGQGYFHTCGNPRTCCNPNHITLMNRKERKRNLTSVWKKQNKDKTAIHNKTQYYKNPEKRRKNSSEWVKNNREWVNSRARKYNKERESSDPIYRLRRRISVLIKNGMATKGFTKKGTKTEAILGCTVSEFRCHIERQFLKGMNWSNHGEWHLDHIVPISSASSEREIYELNHYTNFRPLWAKDNLSKGARMEFLI